MRHRVLLLLALLASVLLLSSCFPTAAAAGPCFYCTEPTLR